MSKTYNPEFAEILTEVFERIQIRPDVVAQNHLRSAVTSGNLALLRFKQYGVNQFQLVHQNVPVTAGTSSYSLAAGTLDVWQAVLTRGTQDIPMWPISREDYERIPKKSTQGRPFNYFVDKGQTGTGQRTIYLWPTPENSTDVVKIWAWVRADDQTDLSQVAPISYEWIEAYVTEIAWRMARKFAPALVNDLKAEANEARMLAMGDDRDRAPAKFKVRGYIRRRRF